MAQTILEHTPRARSPSQPPFRARLAAAAVSGGLAILLSCVVATVATAQDECVAETEPNDTEQDVVATERCITGTLSSGDQDLAIWVVEPSEATARRTLTLEGVPGTQTLLQIYEVVSDPGAALRLGSLPMLEVSTLPDGPSTMTIEELVLAPGRYLAAITRSGLLGGGEPPASDYRIALESGAPWPASADAEPNDDLADATTVSDTFEVSGDREGSRDVIAWSVTEAGRWDVGTLGAFGESVGVELQDANGVTLDSVSAAGEGRLYDLQLDAGLYHLVVASSGADAAPYILRAHTSSGEGDPEPNDGVHSQDAVVLHDGEPARGRLAKEGDADRFSLAVSDGSPMLRDVRMLWRAGGDRQLCLLGAAGDERACARATEGLTLPSLKLDPGTHVFEVSGTSDPDDPYLLRVDVVGPVVADFESEPNGTVDTATTLESDLGMTARGGADDVDLFRLPVEGDPQLWDIELGGSGIGQVQLVRAGTTPLTSAEVAGDGSWARLRDLYLIPGEHWLRVRSTGPEYSVSMNALGPPDPDHEREPNDDADRSERYRVGERRVGRLPTTADRDVFRFSLAAAEHLRLQLRQPEGGAVTVELRLGDERLAVLEGVPAGEVIEYDVWLEPGDYLLELRPATPSEEPYELTSERLDPYDVEFDKEPNDSAAWARPAPDTLSWAGSASAPGDQDWYLLPPATSAEPLQIRIDGEPSMVRSLAQDGSPNGQQIRLERSDDGVFQTAEPLPVDVPLALMVQTDEDYSIVLEGAGWQPRPAPVALDVAMRWELPIDRVAAYWPEEQRIAGQLVLENRAPQTLEVQLETTTSHHRWSAIPESRTISLPGGSETSVSVEVIAGVDAWGTEPVLISARAVSTDGAQTSATSEVTSLVEAPPVGSRQGWSVPLELLGGLDAAAVRLGAVPGGAIDPDRERRLFDGVTPEGPTGQANQEYGAGFSVFVNDVVDQLPIELDVELAGEGPVPIVGTIINPEASQGAMNEVPRDFELLLSTDGQTWTTALEGTVSPLRVDQAFVLKTPMPATHARLRILSKYGGPSGYLSIGEWKVVAEPGSELGEVEHNVADAALGGHVVSMVPLAPDLGPGVRVLDDELERETVALGEGRELELVLGFQDGRAAQLTRLEWTDPEGTLDAERLGAVEVAASVLGSVGPWVSLGSWELERGADGEVRPFAFEAPTWVRYLRLRGRARADADTVELPARIGAYERRTDDLYRSILGEWGYRSRVGPYEWLAGGSTAIAGIGPDAADGAAGAEKLPEGATRSDRVEIDADEDWYLLQVPDERNTLRVEVDGVPTVGVALTLYDEAGVELPLSFTIAPDGTVVYEAEVEPTETYALRVIQPPFSAVFAFDTSSSMDPYLERVTAGLRSFLADVQPGREVVSLMPFEQAPLVDGWQDDPYLLQDAFENRSSGSGGSSGAEAALVGGSEQLAEREGARAILLVTDAETTTVERTSELWSAFARVRPTVFAVHIGGLLEPVASRQRMQDWAAAGGGYYSYPTTRGEMDRAFERMAAWLRRPATYSLAYETLDIRPAQLAVRTAGTGAGIGEAAALAPGVGVEIILDTSGSMRKRLAGKRRIEIAKGSLRRLIQQSLPEGVPVALRVFGGPGKGRQAGCATSLPLPLQPLDRAKALKAVKKLTAKKNTGTPIAAALRAVLDDLEGVDGLRSVVLITDGDASCGETPDAAIAELVAAGVDVKLDIVGFALEDEELKAQMAEWAKAAGGTFLDATNAAQLSASVSTALSAPYQVHASDGTRVAAGTVGGGAIELDPGTYRVEVLTDPAVVFDPVELDSGASVTLELPVPDDASDD